MKKSILALVLGLTISGGAFAQVEEAFASTLALTISPTITVIRLLDTTSATVATGSLGSLVSAVASFAATVESVESKGVAAKNELREEATMAIDLLANGERVKLKNFRTLAAMIAELKVNEAASLEIEMAASSHQVSFEVMAVKAIMISTEL